MSLRDDIAKRLYQRTCHLTESDCDILTDAILALPIEQAREAVINAARAVEQTEPNSRLRTLAMAVLVSAVAELDALEQQ